MSCWVYIIRSQLTGRYYCGYSDDVERRVRQHNDPEYRLTRTTKIWKGPWELVWKMPCSSRGEAVALEKQIKKRGIGRYLKKVQVAESRLRRDSSPCWGAIRHEKGTGLIIASALFLAFRQAQAPELSRGTQDLRPVNDPGASAQTSDGSCQTRDERVKAEMNRTTSERLICGKRIYLANLVGQIPEFSLAARRGFRGAAYVE